MAMGQLNGKRKEAKMNISPFGDPMIIVVSREMVESEDVDSILNILKRLIESPEVAKANMEHVDITFGGYNNTSEELFEIPAVRNYVYRLDEKFPYWLFFLSKHMLGLQCLMYCFLPPYLTDEAKANIHPKELEKLLVNRWGPAMDHISQYAGLNDSEIKALALRVQKYFTQGRANVL